MSTKSIIRVNITLDENLKEILDIMQQSYPTLSYSDLIRMATGGYYASNRSSFGRNKLTKKDIQNWAATLPEMKLSQEQETDVDKAIEESKKNPGKVYSSVEELMEDLNHID